MAEQEKEEVVETTKEKLREALSAVAEKLRSLAKCSLGIMNCKAGIFAEDMMELQGGEQNRKQIDEIANQVFDELKK